MSEEFILKELDRLLERILTSKFADEVTAVEIGALVEVHHLVKRKNEEIYILIRNKESLRDEVAEQQAEIDKQDVDIMRLKHEVERLTTLCTEQNEELGRLQKVRANILKVMKENISQTKSEAINEFAERLKEEINNDRLENFLNGLKGTPQMKVVTYDCLEDYIDNLVKEMTER